MDMDTLNKKEVTVSFEEMEGKLINDIKEMDSDNFLALIEYMYHVKASINIDDEVEPITIKIDESLGFKTLNEIF